MRSAAVELARHAVRQPQVARLAGEVAGQHQPAVDAPLLEMELQPPALGARRRRAA